MEVDAAQLVKLQVLGRGAYGVVEKMKHQPTGTIMAVKVRKKLFLWVCIDM